MKVGWAHIGEEFTRELRLDVADTSLAADLIGQSISVGTDKRARVGGNGNTTGLQNDKEENVLNQNVVDGNAVGNLDADLKERSLGERSRTRNLAVVVQAGEGLDEVVEDGVGGLVVGGRTVGVDPSKGKVGSQAHVDGHVGLVKVYRLGNVVVVNIVVVDAEAETDNCIGEVDVSVVDRSGDGRLDDV